MGNPLAKVKVGDPLKIPSAAYNAFVDAANDYQRRRNNLPGGGKTTSPPDGLILVKNNSGSLVNRFGVLGVSGVVIDDEINLAEFQNRWALTGDTPAAEHIGKFVVAWEPIADGALGRAFVGGTCPVQVKMNDPADKWADVLAGDATQLASGPAGGAQILYASSATGSSTEWCIVRLGAGDGAGEFPVIVAQNGGADGAVPSTFATWTYDVFAIKPDGTQGSQLNVDAGGSPTAALAVLWARQFAAPTTKATNGTSRIRSDGTLVLLSVDEGYQTEDSDCS